MSAQAGLAWIPSGSVGQWLVAPSWSRVFKAGTASVTYLFKYFIKDIKSNRMRIAQ